VGWRILSKLLVFILDAYRWKNAAEEIRALVGRYTTYIVVGGFGLEDSAEGDVMFMDGVGN
jgi:hypothetical protein